MLCDLGVNAGTQKRYLILSLVSELIPNGR